MLKLTFLAAYRICACTIVALPVLINVIIEPNLVATFIYIPMICLALAGALIYVDAKIENLLNSKIKLAALPSSVKIVFTRYHKACY